MTTKAIASKLDRAASKLQPALRLLGRIRRALECEPTQVNAAIVGLVDALEAELFSLEATVGVVTQATLFDPPAELDGAEDMPEPVDDPYVGMSTEEAIDEREYQRGLQIGKEAAAKERQAIQDEQRDCDDVPASATITFLVDCDYCGAECEAAGNRHTCEHCGKTFEITD